MWVPECELVLHTLSLSPSLSTPPAELYIQSASFTCLTEWDAEAVCFNKWALWGIEQSSLVKPTWKAREDRSAVTCISCHAVQHHGNVQLSVLCTTTLWRRETLLHTNCAHSPGPELGTLLITPTRTLFTRLCRRLRSCQPSIPRNRWTAGTAGNYIMVTPLPLLLFFSHDSHHQSVLAQYQFLFICYFSLGDASQYKSAVILCFDWFSKEARCDNLLQFTFIYNYLSPFCWPCESGL